MVTGKFARTEEEIVSRVKDANEEMIFGVFRQEVLIPYLSYAYAKAHIREGVTESEWKDVEQPRTFEAVRREIAEYLPFAIDKARGGRGLSAARSIVKMKSWLWLIGEDKFLDAFDESTDYGETALVAIGKKFDVPTAKPPGREMHGRVL